MICIDWMTVLNECIKHTCSWEGWCAICSAMTLQKQITISRYPSSCVLLKIISATRKAPKYQSKPPSTSDTQDKAHRKASSEVYTARRIEQARIVPASPGTGGWNARMTSTNNPTACETKLLLLAIYPPASGYESMLAFSKVSICRFGLLPCGV